MDFNIRTEEEIHYSKEPQIENLLELFLQELDVIFGTETATVFGNRKVGNSLESMLWQTTFNADYMQIKLQEEVRQYCLMSEYFNWSVEVKLLRGTVKDIALVDVIIKDKINQSTLTTKKFQFR